jgi:hypothetical protein
MILSHAVSVGQVAQASMGRGNHLPLRAFLPAVAPAACMGGAVDFAFPSAKKTPESQREPLSDVTHLFEHSCKKRAMWERPTWLGSCRQEMLAAQNTAPRASMAATQQTLRSMR